LDPPPCAAAGEKEYETHVAWGLFEAARIDGDRGYGQAGVANVMWALSSQHADGWFPRCCLDAPSQPLTHTIAYALRGVIEAYRFSGNAYFLDAARRTADSLLQVLDRQGRLPGRLRQGWTPAVDWVCLTGTAQLAHCWLLLFQITGDRRYADGGLRANGFVRRTVRLEGPVDMRGGVKGSFPVDGEYGRYEYLNWAAKFLADSLMEEIDLGRDAARHARG
jgi:hypothetical protein